MQAHHGLEEKITRLHGIQFELQKLWDQIERLEVVEPESPELVKLWLRFEGLEAKEKYYLDRVPRQRL